MRVLQRRFGEIPQQVQTRLETQSIEQLENLMDTAIAIEEIYYGLTAKPNVESKTGLKVF